MDTDVINPNLTQTTDDAALGDDRSEDLADSIVGECDVTNCRYNHDNRCHARSIYVQFVSGMAHCGTYEPRHHVNENFDMNVAEDI